VVRVCDHCLVGVYNMKSICFLLWS
jgi:hypothetical protein